MRETGILPDFIVVDGAEGGTGAAPAEFIDHVGVPMHEALMLVHNTLVGLDLRGGIRIGAAGRITRPSTSRAPWRWARTGAMRLADSCSRSAASSRRAAIPTVVQPAWRRRTRTLEAPRRAGQGDAGLQFPREHVEGAARPARAPRAWTIRSRSGPEHILRRLSPIEVRSLAALYRFLEAGRAVASGAGARRVQDVLARGAQRFVRAAGSRAADARQQILVVRRPCDARLVRAG